MNLNFKPHTIIMLVGPSESGKTTFAKNILIPGLQHSDENNNYKTNVQYISSDDIRRDLLGNDYDKYDNIMLEASELAFDFMYKKIDTVTKFPIKSEFVVLDTTGLSKKFRDDIKNIAEKNNYNLDVMVFNYKDMKEYYNYESKNKKLIVNHVGRLRKDVLKDLKSRDFNKIHSIQHKDFLIDGVVNSKYNVKVIGLSDYVSHFLPEEFEYTIIGDVHEKVDYLKELLIKKKFIFDGDMIIGNDRGEHMRIVLSGDWIDKGNNSEGIIEFILENEEYFYLVKGNHENFVYRYLMGELDNLNENVLDNFSSIKTLEKNKDLKDKFIYLVEKSKVFYSYIGINKNSFYVTHAPCLNKYIGKLDKESVNNQMNFKLDRSNDVENELSFVKEESVFNNPYHVFGHVATLKGFKIENKISIDTGIVYGNRLTSVSFGNSRSFFYSVISKEDSTEILEDVFKPKLRKVNLKDLDRSDIKRLNFVAKNKVNYISGTMSPADKDEESNELESLNKGLDYFKSNGVSKVILQPKYMGSRCNIYLNRDIEKSFSVSRNGYIIKKVELKDIYKNLLEKYGSYMDSKNIDILILDGELLPWSTLGEGLIEDQFKPVVISIDKEIDILNKYGFDTEFKKVVKSYEESEFKEDRNVLNKKEMIDKYSNRTYNNYKTIQDFYHVSNSMNRDMWEIFNQQVNFFGQKGDKSFSGFNVLKEVYNDGTEGYFNGNAEDIYKFLSDDEYLVLDLNDEYSYDKAKLFYDLLTDVIGMEGVVIKPLEESENVVPFMKVRNERYLTIVYGYDYKLPLKYSKLMKQKSIRRKLSSSFREHQLGKDMLRFKRDDINIDNNDFKQVVANIIFEAKKEQEIDPRL